MPPTTLNSEEPVIGLISLIWALFNKNSDSSRTHETIRNANRSKED